MKKLIAVLLIISCLYQDAEASREAKLAYIEQYRAIAVQEMYRTGIPASIKMAQALLESNAGTSTLAKKANNHFGIKCGSNWKGKKMLRKDDDYNRKGKLIKSCFRSYKNAEESFIAHSTFLTSQSRYADLFDLASDDYKGWAKGLRKAGYATDPKYEKRLIQIIKQFQLDRLDLDMHSEQVAGQVVFAGEISIIDESRESFQYINDVRCIVAQGGEMVKEIVKEYPISARKMVKYNDQIHSEEQRLLAGQIVFLQPPRKQYRGREKTHKVEQGESMLSIATRYGLDLNELYRRNRIPKGKQPASGEMIYLRGKASVKNPIRTWSTSVASGSEVNNPPFHSSSETEDEAIPELVARKDREDSPALITESTPVQVQYHTVQKGDTLYQLSKRFGISIDALMEVNHLTGHVIQVGQKLKVSL